ncbi:helix-turn-helix domain-containing protein [Halobaculum halobium]|uniref:Helix-turn-helix domain-containing protein n=1 Tax=Halobaculum halobium TaxID=3032281 RepID=A0ABD5TAK5_9EURY|nr:helix-turn-helix domain-containing protein [Halobaculum sp. SYNS20]
MTTSISEQLEQPMQCEGLLRCVFGVSELDREVYEVLTTEGHPCTVEQVADTIDSDRSTAYRSLRRLVDVGAVSRRPVSYNDGGCYHVFEPVDADELVDSLHQYLDEWYRRIDGLIVEFEQRHSSKSRQAADGERV